MFSPLVLIFTLLALAWIDGTVARPPRRGPMHNQMDMNSESPDTPDKYFHESIFDIHYDGRFTDGRLPYEHHRSSLILLAQTCLTTFNEIGIETWIMHGSLIGWYWNRRILPWDSDIDLQISERSMEHLAQYYNMSTHSFSVGDSSLRRNYLLEINPHFRNTSTADTVNMIDARWIDTDTGLFLDLTTLRHNKSRELEGTDGAMFCKDGHHYRYDDIYPLRDTTFEGVPAKVPSAYKQVIVEEYHEQAISSKFYSNHEFDDEKEEWIPAEHQQRSTEEPISSFVPRLEQAAREAMEGPVLKRL